jgi:RNA polymerase-binding transcription factor
MKVSEQHREHGHLQRLRRILDRERAQTYERIRELRDEQQQDATPLPSDEFDEARALAEIETHARLIEVAEGRLNEIDDALARLETNRYGLCEGCGNEIPIARLRALPFATYCVRCQQKRDVKESSDRSIDEASSRLWQTPTEMDESLETQDAIAEPEERLSVRDKKPFGSELGEFEQLPPVATARRRGRIKPRNREQ